MDDLPIQSLLKRSSRDPGEVRSTPRTGQDNFERQLRKATAPPPTKPPDRPAASPPKPADEHPVDVAAPDQSSGEQHLGSDAIPSTAETVPVVPTGSTEFTLVTLEAEQFALEAPPEIDARGEVITTDDAERPIESIVSLVPSVEGQIFQATTEVASEVASTTSQTAEATPRLATNSEQPVDKTGELSQQQVATIEFAEIESAEIEPTAPPESPVKLPVKEQPDLPPVPLAELAATTLDSPAVQSAVVQPSEVPSTKPTRKSASLAQATSEIAATSGETDKSPKVVESLLETGAPVPVDLAPETNALVVELDASTEEANVKPESTTAAPPRESEGRGLLDRLQAGRTTIAAPSETLSADLESRVDAARFVGRVAGAVRAAQDRGGVVQLRLSPPELGAMKLELLLEGGTLTARIEAETATARKVLLDNLPALRERLAQQEIRIERFDVDVRREGTGGQPDWQAGDRRQQSSQSGGHQLPKREASTTDPGSVPTRKPAIISDGRLNVVA